MANITRNFIAGKMNKVVDQRIIPDGEYVDAMNIRMGSTENSEVGVIENTKGNLNLTALSYDGQLLSTNARCIGAIQDSANETLYWFVHDPEFSGSNTGKLDLIVSYNITPTTPIQTYHVISIDDGDGVDTILNFNPSYLITGVNILNDLLFFTDDYNPPRFININRNYPNPIGGIDQVSAESLLVIKKPPVESPTVTPFVTNGQENYLETRFICFAYRYRYIDGEYSATSQWSAPAFVPNDFSFSDESFLNEGMTNFCNAATINYNTGGPLVVGIDLLFKQSENNIIKVIEKLDKSNLGLVDNTNYDYVFQNSKIFTILSEAELLRLYDNVPRFAKAQTIMGNRLMYGNYVEGYDLVDSLGRPINFTTLYSTDLISEDIGSTTITDGLDDAVYQIDGTVNVENSIVTFDLSDANLISGSSVSFNITITHDKFSGTTTPPTELTGSVSLVFPFYLSKDYTSVYQFATSTEFQNAKGTIANIQPVATACDGKTFTDKFNCELPNNLNTFEKTDSGINAIGEPIEVITSPGSSILGFQFPAMEYVDPITSHISYEYYRIVSANGIFQEIANKKSLHSNRDYEIGIIYMDEYNRATTALVSQNNTEHIPCGSSNKKNSIQVTIPKDQLPPVWATRYKFVIKPDQERYETIYSNIYFQDPNSNNAYFLLEGENAQKIEVGDRLIVKSDSDGPTQTCTYATVLEKEAKATGFLQITNVTSPDPIDAPGGTYMKINPNSFSVVVDPLAVIAPGEEHVEFHLGGSYPDLSYDMNYFNHTTGVWEDYDVPEGSRIRLQFKQTRAGWNNTTCGERTSDLDKTFTASQNYPNMYEWFLGDGIGEYLNDGKRYATTGCTPTNVFLPDLLEVTTPPPMPTDPCINYYQFYRYISANPLLNNKLQLFMTGAQVCSPVGSHFYRAASHIYATVTVYRADNTVIFETEPSDALPDVFFENELSLPITNGYHMGNIQNQTSSLPAIIDTQFFNCFAFGNGVESYKIRDSILGRSFNFGNRVTSVSAQDYKAADRFSDITYSGIYNAESNVNKLNEFNLGLLDYKHLETSFGEIFVLDGRETDVLVLQEDKISYVLASKNLLSDASAGGVVTATPEVLGTQIARTEKYGISFNPESYVHWGYDRFFTDVKRGAVIQLRGNSYSNEELKVSSDLGMRTWFRDNFNDTFNYQKLGGFDPYMNEYILSTNDINLPVIPKCTECGISQTLTLTLIGSVEEEKQIEFCVDFGPTVGPTEVNFVVSDIQPTEQFNVTITYDGSSVTSGWIDSDISMIFNKNSISVTTATITINYTGSMFLNVTPNCPSAELLSIVQIVLTSNSEAGDTVHTQYSYVDGTYTSPLQSSFVSFVSGSTSPLVSRYNMITGPVGTGSFPPVGSTISLISNKFATDTFIFDPTSDKFKYYRTNVLYDNTSVDINSLLAVSLTATPNQGGGSVNYADFTVPSFGNYLYLIWDFRNSIPQSLCYSSETIENVCCSCDITSYPNTLCFSDISVANVCCNCDEASIALCYSTISDTDACCGCEIP